MNSQSLKPKISVVIPTYNRASLLYHSLSSLVRQTIPKSEFEVIVINDGSKDNTHEVCQSFEKKLNIKWFSIKNSGISTAKNIGLFASKAEIVFFFDDDDVAHKNLLSEHIKTHKKFPEESTVVLGNTKWSSRLKITYIMEYVMNISGELFYYKGMQHEDELDYTFFWGGRSSCKRSFLLNNGIFNQVFKFGFEDIELSYRLRKLGIKVIYNMHAKSYMIRPVTFDEFIKRKEKQGKSLFTFINLHPSDRVRRYADVKFDDEKIAHINEFYQDKVEKVKKLEKLLVDSKVEEETKKIKIELNKLYRWVFDASKIKGYNKEKRNNTVIEDYNYLQFGDELLKVFMKHKDKITVPTPREQILIIDPLLPMHDRASGSLRLFQIIKGLIELNYKVTYISQQDIYSEVYVPQLIELGVEVYAGDAEAMHLEESNRIGPKLNLTKILTESNYSYALLSFWSVGYYYLNKIREASPNTKIILDSVDIHFVREIREAKLINNNELLNSALLNKSKELKTYSNSDEVWVITENEKRVLEENDIRTPLNIVPNIHNEVSFHKTYDKSKDILFIGNFWHAPNIDAMLFFCNEVFNKIKEQVPDIKLYIVGNNPTKEIKNLASENIVVTGYVEDLDFYLKKARISIAPLRFGAGMKGKVGEALSWGIPVVTTTIGAEGMNLVNMENCIIADNPDDFANSIVKLYEDKPLWEKISLNGKKHVEQNWSYSAILEKLKRIFDKYVELSIVIPTFNHWDYTKQTIESIQKFTGNKFEIIIVDNASTDETIAELKNYDNVKVIANKKNLGFPIAVNQGILKAKGKYVLIANNDIIFTENWFNRMLEIAKQHPEVGIVGPISNSVSGRQLDKNAKYKSIPEMHKYAAKIKKENKGQFFQFPRVAFLCTLIKKEVIDKIGGLDERYSPGNFEDDDFCLRAQMAGYKTIIATDVFIHHYGSVSFKADGEDKYAKRIEINKQKFVDKWGANPEEIWIKGNKPKQREIKYSINNDIFIQHIERSFTNIDENEPLLAIENLEIAAEQFKNSERKGFENLVLDELIVILGNLYFATNNLEKAKETFEKALNENPNSSTACQGLGEIFQAIEEYEPAKMMFEWAVKNDELNKTAFQKLKELNKSLGLNENDFSLSEES